VRRNHAVRGRYTECLERIRRPVPGARNRKTFLETASMKIPGKWSALLAPALLLATLPGCDGLFGTDNDAAQREQFTASLNAWRAANVDDYGYTLELNCACAPASQLGIVRVTVRNGAVVSRVYTNGTAAPESVFGPYDTVEELFDVVEDAISRDADLLSVIYHPTYGFPSLLQLDPSTSDADDHLEFVVSEFAPAPAS
jgi:Family of unknown function (DUF6174)